MLHITTTRRTARLLKWGAIPAALLVSGLIVGHASYSAFNATTSNPTSNWSAGTVVLTDDDSNTAMFTATGLKPGSTDTKCIAVTSSGSLASSVKLYGTSPSTTDALSTYIHLSIVQGTGGSSGSCTGFTPLVTGSSLYSGTLANFATTSTDYANGLGTWTPTGTAPETRTFEFTYLVDATTPNTSQGGTAAIGFTWEDQNV
jgi:hypothetical protein